MKLRSIAVVALASMAVALAGCSAGPGDGGEDTSSTSSLVSTEPLTTLVPDIARANLGKGACSTNSFDQHGYYTSCYGNGGLPEYWCSDFARWVWLKAGVHYVDELTAAAGSFYLYGHRHGTLHGRPVPGDAVVFNYRGGGVADHVAIVSYVSDDGKRMDTISGDWDGQSGSEAHFASTSHVIRNSPEYDDAIGDWPAIMGMKISAFVAPVR